MVTGSPFQRSPLSLYRASWRFFRQHPWQLWLSLLSIALGSAVIIAVDLANNTANASFNRSIESLTGRSTHQLVNKASVDKGIDEAVYTRLRNEWRIRGSAPVIEAEVIIGGESFTLYGADPFAASMFAGEAGALDGNLLLQTLQTANGILMAEQTAQRLGLQLKQAFKARINHAEARLMPLAFLPGGQAAGLENVFLADIATVQELSGALGKLDHIALILNESQHQYLQSVLPQTLQLRERLDKAGALQQMTAAFRTNLTAMALLAMLIGAFLVYNTMTFSVLQRRKQFAVERMLGVTGAQLFQHVLAEALLLGLLGSVLGILLGVALGQTLLALITRTINDLYTAIDLSVLLIQPMLLVKGVGVTLSAVLLAALGPAWEAARVQPTLVNRCSELELRMLRMTPLLLASGAALMLLCLGLLWLFERSLVAGFAAMFAMVIAYSLWSPLLINALLAILEKSPLRRNLLAAMAVRGIQSMRSRTHLAIIALAVAVSATVGVSIMISSFRHNVAEWLTMTLQSDLYVSVSNQGMKRATATLDPFWLEQIPLLPGVKSISSGRQLTVVIKQTPTPVLVLDPGVRKDGGFRFLKGADSRLWQRYDAGEIVLVSEPLAYHQQLDVGDKFSVETESGNTLELKAGAIFQDYSATQGMLVMPPLLYRQYWGDNERTSIGITLEADADAGALHRQLASMAAKAQQAVMIRHNRDIRQHSLEIFDRTFAITQVLRLLVILVAFVGVFSALMALFLEKSREYAVLRATGMTPRQLDGMVILQAAVIGLLAGLLALPLGWLMAELLIEVINQRSFGWTLERVFTPGVLVQAIVLSVIAAFLAAVYPVWRISRLSIRQGLRE